MIEKSVPNWSWEKGCIERIVGNVCQELLNLYKEHDFLTNIATGNESWVH